MEKWTLLRQHLWAGDGWDLVHGGLHPGEYPDLAFIKTTNTKTDIVEVHMAEY